MDEKSRLLYQLRNDSLEKIEEFPMPPGLISKDDNNLPDIA